MAARLSFHYRPGDSLLHVWDPRCKIVAIMLATFCLLKMEIPALGLFSLFLVLLLPAVGMSGQRLAVELRFWWWLLLLIFVTQAVFTPGTQVPALEPVPVSWEGLVLGGMTAWRLVLVIGYGVVFTASTRHREVGDALRWFLRRLGLRAGRLALMAALTVRCIPLLMDVSDGMRDAGRARAADATRNPLRRARSIVLPLMRNSLLRSDDLACALFSRGINAARPLALRRVPWTHVAALLVFAVTVVASLYLE